MASSSLGHRRAPFWAVVASALLLWTTVSFAQQDAQAPATYFVIVHPSNPYGTLSRRFVSEAFLKKTTRWGNGETIRPIDLAGGSVLRRRFTREIVGRSLESLRSYWQQLIFSGRGLPPVEAATEDDVVRMVLRARGSIGYVSRGVDLRGAKIVVVR